MCVCGGGGGGGMGGGGGGGGNVEGSVYFMSHPKDFSSLHRIFVSGEI